METSMHDLIIVIVNRGFSETVMDAARERGARGGTILHGRGTGAEMLQQFYNMVLQEEKELVLIVASKDIRKNIMDGIMRAAGLATDAHGVVFSLPVEDFVILKKHRGPDVTDPDEGNEEE